MEAADQKSPSFSVGNVPIYGDMTLSPMAGLSDSPFRRICRKMGAAFSFTEFVNVDQICHGNKKCFSLFRFETEERPIIFQIFGNDLNTILNAAHIIQDLKPDAIDLNMGCSVNRVACRGAGAGLLREPKKVALIIKSLSDSLDIPVTAKIRLGWDERSRNFLEIARTLEDSGVALISVHGRTRSQAYTGKADWESISLLKAAVSVPVLGNGDIDSFDSAKKMKQESSVDGVLIGRKAVGNPWIFSGSDARKIRFTERLAVVFQHLNMMEDFYLEEGLKLFRKHAAAYFFDIDVGFRKMMLTETNTDRFRQLCFDAEAHRIEAKPLVTG